MGKKKRKRHCNRTEESIDQFPKRSGSGDGMPSEDNLTRDPKRPKKEEPTIAGSNNKKNEKGTGTKSIGLRHFCTDRSQANA